MKKYLMLLIIALLFTGCTTENPTLKKEEELTLNGTFKAVYQKMWNDSEEETIEKLADKYVTFSSDKIEFCSKGLEEANMICVIDEFKANNNIITTAGNETYKYYFENNNLILELEVEGMNSFIKYIKSTAKSKQDAIDNAKSYEVVNLTTNKNKLCVCNENNSCGEGQTCTIAGICCSGTSCCE